jgi:hypothetical protein
MTLVDLEEKRLERLPPRELSRHLMRLPVKKRLETILRREDADRVMAALPEQDFYLSVKEIGPEDSLPFLALATVPQLDHLFDLEWWRKDKIAPAKALEWLERLSRAGEERLLAWLYQVDFELLVALFKKWLRVVVAPEDTDPIEVTEQLPSNTLDDQFFWEAQYPQYEDFLRLLLSFLFEVNYGYYKELMEHANWPIEAEIEEEAYRFHSARLEDRAIPDFYDALAIYQPIRSKEIPVRKKSSDVQHLEGSPPSFALALVPDGDFLKTVLRDIRDDALIGTLQLELASLANKVIVADQVELDSAEALRHAADKAAACVNLGLLLQSSGDVDTAASILKEVFLEHLFRLGHSRMAVLRNRLRQVTREGWLSKWPEGIKCLDTDWLESAELLLLKTPRILKRSSGERALHREDFFRNLKDLAEGNRIVDTIAALGPLFDSLDIQPRALHDRLWTEGQIRNLEDVTLGAMVWTAAARFQLTGKWQVELLPVEKWSALYSLLKPPVVESLIRSRVEEVLPVSTPRLLIDAYLNPLFREYEEEMAPFDEHNQPDPKLAKLFMFEGP